VSTAEIRTALGSIGRKRSAAEAGRSPDRPVEAGRIPGIGRRNTLEGLAQTHCRESSCRSGRNPFEVDTAAWMLFRQRSQVRETRTLGVRAGKRAEPGWLAKPVKRTEPNISRAYESLGFRSRRPKAGESPAMRRQSTLQQVEATKGRPGPNAHGRTNVSLARRQAAHLSAEETWRGEVVIFGWQPCSKADQRSTLRHFRDRRTSHQPMSSERAGKSVRADWKRVARLAVRRAEGRNEPAERSIGKTLVLARVAGSVVAGHGLGPGADRGIAERQVGQQWQAGREARAGCVSTTHSSACRRTP
jgi:hypothetical protein